MDISLILIFRLIHVVAGALWVGAAVVYLFYIKPTVKSIGPAGPQFMQNLANRARYPMFMLSISLLTVLAGAALFWNSSGGFNGNWLRTGPGIGFTIGSVAALVAFLVGSIGIGPTSASMGALGQQIAKAGGPPTSEQMNKLQALENKLNRAEVVDFVMLTISMLTMATARYWVF